jgi:hypothetical protein
MERLLVVGVMGYRVVLKVFCGFCIWQSDCQEEVGTLNGSRIQQLFAIGRLGWRFLTPTSGDLQRLKALKTLISGKQQSKTAIFTAKRCFSRIKTD